MSKKLIYAISFVFLLGSAQAAQLTDAELYFDPASIVPDYYPRFELADLTVENTLIWQGDPNAIIDVDILPILKPGDYPEIPDERFHLFLYEKRLGGDHTKG